MSSPIVLNKIDQVIVNNVQHQTTAGVIHTSDKIRIAEYKKDRQKDNQPRNKSKKEKLKEINSILKDAGASVSFMIDGEKLVFKDKDGNVIRALDENALDEILYRIQNMSGVFIDFKK